VKLQVDTNVSEEHTASIFIPPSSPHGVTTQKTAMDMTAVRTSNIIIIFVGEIGAD
jgi:hypothetical protein